MIWLLRRLILAVAVAGAAVSYLGHHHAAPPARSAGYVNPLAGGRWTDARTDQGVDYQPAVPEPVRAIGSGVVAYSSTSDCLPHGWPGCAVIGYRLTAGPKKGAVIYVAEHLEHLLPEGARVRPGTVLATALPGYPWIETGWANCAGDAPVVQYHGAVDGTPMAGGLAFARFMRELGASTAMNPGPGPDVKRCR
jgi:hypothetical protein